MPRSPFVTLFLAGLLCACSSLDIPSATKVESRAAPRELSTVSNVGVLPADASSQVVGPVVDLIEANERAEVGAYIVAVDASNRAEYAALVAAQEEAARQAAAAEAAARAAQQHASMPAPSSTPQNAPVPAPSRSSGGAHSDAWWHGVSICEQGGRNDSFFGYFSIMDGSAGGLDWSTQVGMANGIISRNGDGAWAASCVAAGYAASPSG